MMLNAGFWLFAAFAAWGFDYDGEPLRPSACAASVLAVGSYGTARMVRRGRNATGTLIAWLARRQERQIRRNAERIEQNAQRIARCESRDQGYAKIMELGGLGAPPEFGDTIPGGLRLVPPVRSEDESVAG